MQQGHSGAALLTALLTFLRDKGTPDNPAEVVQWRALWLPNVDHDLFSEMVLRATQIVDVVCMAALVPPTFPLFQTWEKDIESCS